jgi:hypothetical protein
MGKVEFWDGLFYVFAQFLGAIGGVALARYVLRSAISNQAVHYAVTAPGVYGCAVAFMAELTMSFLLMITVLFATNHKRLAPYSAYFVGALIAMFYPVGAALSGMSTNRLTRSGQQFRPAAGTPSGSISSLRRWACWRPLRYFFESVGASLHTALNFITPMTHAASSVTHHNPPRGYQPEEIYETGTHSRRAVRDLPGKHKGPTSTVTKHGDTIYVTGAPPMLLVVFIGVHPVGGGITVSRFTVSYFELFFGSTTARQLATYY